MIDRRGLEHRLAQARLGLSPSAAAQTRVLDGLSAARAASPSRASGFTAARVALLMGLSVALGYGLGLHGALGGADGAAPPEGSGALQAAASPPVLPPAPPAMLSPPPPEGAAVSDAVAAAPRAQELSLPAPSSRPSMVRPAEPRRGGQSSEVTPHAELARDSAARALRDELALLRRIERAVRAKEAALALALLDELDRRYPRTALLEERSAARVLADCLLASPNAHADAGGFLARYGDTVYADRVRQACELDAELQPEGSGERGH